MLRPITIFVISACMTSQILATEVYRTTDENGRPVFSNTPPATDHDVIDVEIKNKLGGKNQPDPSSRYYSFSGSSHSSRRYRPSSANKASKVSGAELQEKCERYRNIVRSNNKQKKKRDYWCSRLHRGK